MIGLLCTTFTSTIFDSWTFLQFVYQSIPVLHVEVIQASFLFQISFLVLKKKDFSIQLRLSIAITNKEIKRGSQEFVSCYRNIVSSWVG